MENKHDIQKDEYYCIQCNKKYKTYKTLWEHNKKFHNDKCNANVIICNSKRNENVICNSKYNLKKM